MTTADEQARWDAIDRPLGWLIALGGCVLILDQTIVQTGRLADFAPLWNAGALLVIAAILMSAEASQRKCQKLHFSLVRIGSTAA